MRDPFALVVWLLGTAVMAYGFWTTVMAQEAGVAPDMWDAIMVIGGFLASCIGGYAVGRAHAVPGAWSED